MNRQLALHIIMPTHKTITNDQCPPRAKGEMNLGEYGLGRAWDQIQVFDPACTIPIKRKSLLKAYWANIIL